MGIIRRAWDWLNGPVGFAADETPPRPLADVLLEMAGRGLLPRVGRSEALSVPAVLRGRNLICSLATLPLVQKDADLQTVRLPLLEQIDPNVANVVTLAQTIEDLLFDGIAWWKITAFGADGYPVSAEHKDVGSVSLNPPVGRNISPLPSGWDPREAVVYVDGEPTPGSLMIRFDSPNPGLLTAGGRAVRRAVLLDTTSALYADNPRPMDYFTPTEGADPADDATVQKILADWAYYRRKRSTGYVPASLTYNSVDTPTPAELQLIELQRKATLDLANAMGLDPEDLGISTTSRTYQNAVDRRRDRINDVLAPYMSAVTDRLSMGDVTKRGRKVNFDLKEYLRADPKTRSEVNTAYITAGVMAPSEARTDEGWPEMTPAQRAEVEPAQPAEPAPDNVVPIRSRQALAADEDEPLLFDVDIQPLARVDLERRIIEGIVVPYGPDKIAWKGGRRWRFQLGSLVPPRELHRNKALRDHDNAQPQGKLIFHEDRPEGMFARYKIKDGPDGDRTLAEAAEQIRDGFSVGVEINDAGPDPLNQGVFLVAVGGAAWRETSVLAVPAFDDARVTRVAAQAETGVHVKCSICGQVHAEGAPACTPANPTPPANQPTDPPPAAPVRLNNDQLQGLLQVPGVLQALAGVSAQPAQQQEQAQFGLYPEQIKALLQIPNVLPMLVGAGVSAQPAQPEQRQTVDPTRKFGGATTHEPPSYVFDRKGNLRPGKFDFSSDVIKGLKFNDGEALERAQKFVSEQFAQFDTDMADAAALNPSRQRPDMYVDQKQYQYPIWDAINKGTLADMTPFVLPKFSSASGMVAAHTEGVEPSLGTYTATSQTITPSAVSGKVSITREAWDQGGNPQLSTLIWDKMVSAWYEALEASAVTLLEGLTLAGALTITLTTGATDDALVSEIKRKLAALQFIRGGFRMRDAFGQVDLYTALIDATDADGRPLLPQIQPSNADGQTNPLWGAIGIGGLLMKPSWALAATGSVSANSYLFDRADVSGWATAPDRITMENIEVRYVHMGIWGYKATACTDTSGVRRLAYDPAP